ncbi:MAG: DoxX family protein [Bacteroidota bacterium]
MSSSTSLALLLLRLWFGLEMLIAHGIPKWNKILSGDLGFPDPLGIGSELSLYLVTFAELVCAAMIAVGLKARLATLPYLFAMLVAAWLHFDNPEDGWSKVAYPLHYFMAALAVLIAGPGRYSLDQKLAERQMI